MTPVLEFAEVIDRAQEGGLRDAFRLFDADGRVLVLRPDLTIPIARLVATRMADHPGPGPRVVRGPRRSARRRRDARARPSSARPASSWWATAGPGARRRGASPCWSESLARHRPARACASASATCR